MMADAFFGMAILLSGFAGILVSAFVEYGFHKKYLHRDAKNGHIVIHHKDFHGNSAYENPHAKWKDVASSWAYIFANVAIYFPLSVFLCIFSRAWAGVFFFCALTYTFWVEGSHYLFHAPKGYYFEKWKWFQLVKEHHRIHHVVYSRNFGIGSTFWDHVLKTKNKG